MQNETDTLEDIVGSSFIEGWEMAVMLLEDEYGLVLNESHKAAVMATRTADCEHYVSDFNNLHLMSPILTREIIEDIWENGCACGQGYDGAEIEVYLKKYNLEQE